MGVKSDYKFNKVLFPVQTSKEKNKFAHENILQESKQTKFTVRMNQPKRLANVLK
jgi:hypothetical protein